MYGPNKGKVSEKVKNSMFSETFHAFLYTVFNSRNQPKDLFSYVPMKEEQEVIGYIESKRTDSCIISGARGIGKSTLVEQLERKYKENGEFLLIKIDFNQTIAKLSENKTEKNYVLSEDDDNATDKKTTSVDNILASYLLTEVDNLFAQKGEGFLTSEEQVDEFFNYIKEKHGHFLHSQDITPTIRITFEDRCNVIESLRKQRPFRYMLAALGFLVFKVEIKRVIVVIDNVDDCPSSLIEEIYKRMSTMTVCLDRDNAISLLFILTCRDFVYNELFCKTGRNLGQYHGHQEIRIRKPCSIHALIKNRIRIIKENQPELYEKIDDQVISRNNFKWTISDRNLFLNTLCNLIERNNYGENLDQLCNYDMSEVIRQFYNNIIRNDDIIKLEHILQLMKFSADDIRQYRLSEEEKIGKPIAWHEFLNCLAYGVGNNQKRFYPLNNTVVANLLWWRANKGYSILSRIRILQYLDNEEDSKFLTGKEIIRRLMIPYLGFKADQGDECNPSETSLIAESFLERMADDGLLFFSRKKSIPDNKPALNDTLVESHKAKLLMSLFSNQSLLLEYYYDDTYRDIDSFKPNCILSDVAIEDKPNKLTHFLEYLAICERKQLKNIDQNCLGGGLNDFIKMVGKKSIAEIMYQGLASSIEKFYDKNSKSVNDDGLKKVAQIIKETNTILGNFSDNPMQ